MEGTCLYAQVAEIVNAPIDQQLFFYRPFTNFAFFGDVLLSDSADGASLLFPILNHRDDKIARKPLGYTQIFDFADLGCQDGPKVYYPVAPAGFRAIGCVIARDVSQIPRNCYCVREDLTEQGECNVIDVFSPF